MATLSFMTLVKKTGTLAKSSRSKRIDPLTLAKNKVVTALKVQQGYVALVAEDKPLPKNGEREAATWFSKHNDGWWSNIRYGQVPIPVGDNGQADMLIGTLEDVAAFYGAVAAAIGRGELDAQILKLQTERSAALTKKGNQLAKAA